MLLFPPLGGRRASNRNFSKLKSWWTTRQTAKSSSAGWTLHSGNFTIFINPSSPPNVRGPRKHLSPERDSSGKRALENTPQSCPLEQMCPPSRRTLVPPSGPSWCLKWKRCCPRSPVPETAERAPGASPSLGTLAFGRTPIAQGHPHAA